MKDFGSWGSYGEVGTYGIEKMGNNFYCLKYDNGMQGNQGYFTAQTFYFSLNSYCDISEVFSYIYEQQDPGSPDKEGGDGWVETSTIRIVPAGELYNIEQKTMRDGKLISNLVYKYSDNLGKYVLSDSK